MHLTAEEIRELYRLGQEVGADEEEEIDGDLPALRGLPAPGELRQTIARESELRRRDLSVPEEAWLSQPSEDREELRSAWNLLRTALAEVLEMRKHPHLLECMDAGRRGGPPRELWDDFVRFISGLREEIERDEALARRRTVVLACEPIDDRLLANIRALRSALSHEKTAFRLLARMGKSIHPSWRAIISASQVEGRLPASDDDFEAVEAFVRVRVNRSRLIHRWRQHLEPYPQLAQIALGDRPEVASHQHLDQLTHALSWHERHWVSAVAALRSSGIALEAAVRRAAPRTDRFGELHRLIDAANGSVRDWLQRRLQHLELNEIAARLQDWSGRLRQIAPERDTSGLARSMLDAMESRDASMYGAAHERVSMLERKRSSVERRRPRLE